MLLRFLDAPAGEAPLLLDGAGDGFGPDSGRRHRRGAGRLPEALEGLVEAGAGVEGALVA